MFPSLPKKSNIWMVFFKSENCIFSFICVISMKFHNVSLWINYFHIERILWEFPKCFHVRIISTCTCGTILYFQKSYTLTNISYIFCCCKSHSLLELKAINENLTCAGTVANCLLSLRKMEMGGRDQIYIYTCKLRMV